MVTASFLGVGAPEAVLVGVVALVVFGPKGLAEVRLGTNKRNTESNDWLCGSREHRGPSKDSICRADAAQMCCQPARAADLS